tara:strand:- start:18182 stop:19177 length:996 start_codon:yes stop_codon:yes gene_type:complete
MGGFDALKSEEKKGGESKGNKEVMLIERVLEREEKEAPAEISDIALEVEAAADENLGTHVFCGVIGFEGAGKSGIVLDSLTSQQKQDGDYILALDFDGGAAACKSAYHRSISPNIRCLSPWVMATEDRTTYDYPATHDRVMEIGRYAVKQAHKQSQTGYEGPRLAKFLVTAVDQWDTVCIVNMKVIELGKAKDGIEASDPNRLVGNQWNWSIRSTRFHQLTAICRELMRLGVQVFWETHLKAEVFRNEQTGSWKPDWEKNTDANLKQILWCRREDVLDDDGQKTGTTNYTVEFWKENTNIALQGQKRTIAMTRKGGEPEWYGLKELKEGLL